MPLLHPRELKQNVGDGLRGMRHLVRMLGSDAQRRRFAPPALPEAMPQLDTLVGIAFRAVDDVMCAVETAATPLRRAPTGFRGFASPASYFIEGGERPFADDMYRALEALCACDAAPPFILKARFGDLHRRLKLRPDLFALSGLGLAALLRGLVAADPLVGREGPASANFKPYIAATLLFGLAASGRIDRQEAPLVLEDALLLANARLDGLSQAVAESTDEMLAAMLERLVHQLA